MSETERGVRRKANEKPGASGLRIESPRKLRHGGAFRMSDVHYEVVFFSGRVQGVGFRYATSQVAKEFEVSGWVANLPDGRVQAEVEGTKAEVDAFIEAIADRMHGFIRKIDRTAGRRPPQFQGFTIRA